jgi:hypothetical protein
VVPYFANGLVARELLLGLAIQIYELTSYKNLFSVIMSLFLTLRMVGSVWIALCSAVGANICTEAQTEDIVHQLKENRHFAKEPPTEKQFSAFFPLEGQGFSSFRITWLAEGQGFLPFRTWNPFHTT